MCHELHFNLVPALLLSCAYSNSWCAPARYITAFQRGFDEGLRNVQLSFMQSDGGLAPVDAFSGHKAILSGPAGGCALVVAKQWAFFLGTWLFKQTQTFRLVCSELLCSRCRYVGYALTTQWEGRQAKSQQVIGFDMGGTSTDVSRFAGTYEHVFESVTAGAE